MTDLDHRLGALEAAMTAARDRLDTDVLESASEVFEHANARLRLAPDHTVVVLGGSTGSGKSSLFNTISGLEIADVGYLRPTTAEALACAWGPGGATDLLDWMGVLRRNQISRRSHLDVMDRHTDFEGLVLVDLPDHDSVVVDNKLVVDRLVAHTDLFVWVLDPQKYADAAIHEQYLEPLSTHRETTLVVLNQIDRLSTQDQEIALADLRRILDAEGLYEVPILATSTVTGQGIVELRREIRERIASKETASARLVGDVRAAAASLVEAGGDHVAPGVQPGHRDKLVEIFGVCIGIDQMADAVEDSMLRRAAVATDWPLIGWIGRIRRDPLKAIGLGRSVRDVLAPDMLMTPSVQRSRAELALREVAEASVSGLSRPWRSAILDQVTGLGARDVIDELDRSISDIDPGVDHRRWWWGVFSFLQWFALITLIAGVVILALSFIPNPVTVGADSLPAPKGVRLDLWFIGIGLFLAVSLTVSARFFGALGAHRTAVKFEKKLRKAVANTTDTVVLSRLQNELDRYERYRAGVRIAAA